MKKGDLVDFHTSAWVFENAARDYSNPGLILKVVSASNVVGIKASSRYQVYWADGRVTTEYACYLQPSCTKSNKSL